MTPLPCRINNWAATPIPTWRLCKKEDRAIVTLDLDFSDIRAYPPADYPEIIVLRLARLDKHRVLSAIQRLLLVFNQEPLAGKLWIVDETTVRIRG